MDLVEAGGALGHKALRVEDGVLAVPIGDTAIVPDRGGTPVFPGPSHITDHRSPFKERWGGWYATGTHGAARHMGNVYVEKGEPADSLDPSQGANVEDLQRLNK